MLNVTKFNMERPTLASVVLFLLPVAIVTSDTAMIATVKSMANANHC